MGILKQALAKKITRFLLKVHHITYAMLGRFVCAAEGGLHPKHRLTNYHKFFVDNINEDDVVLDCGCGNGALTFDLAKKAKFIKGIDISEENIAVCKTKYPRMNAEYIAADITTYMPKEKFSIVILSNVLEHIEDRQTFLDKLSYIANKLLVRIPMLNRDWVTLYKKELNLPYMLDPTHRIEYTLDSFKGELGKVGFKLHDYSIQFGEIWAVVTKD